MLWRGSMMERAFHDGLPINDLAGRPSANFSEKFATSAVPLAVDRVGRISDTGPLMAPASTCVKRRRPSPSEGLFHELGIFEGPRLSA